MKHPAHDSRTIWHPQAEREVEKAAQWYEVRSELAAARFIDDLDSTVARVVTAPRQFPSIEYGLRRALLSSFPHAVIFRESSPEIQIVAIAHGKRRPEYWRRRTFITPPKS